MVQVLFIRGSTCLINDCLSLKGAICSKRRFVVLLPILNSLSEFRRKTLRGTLRELFRSVKWFPFTSRAPYYRKKLLKQWVTSEITRSISAVTRLRFKYVAAFLLESSVEFARKSRLWFFQRSTRGSILTQVSFFRFLCSCNFIILVAKSAIYPLVSLFRRKVCITT